MKIVIVNAHSYHNRGDAAILQTMANSLKQEFPSCKIVVCSDTPIEDQVAYKKMRVIGIAYPWLKAPSSLKRIIAIFFHLRYWLCAFFKKVGIKSFIPFQKDALKVIEEIVNADMVVSCGGGYLNSLGKLFSRLSLVYTGTFFGKPTIFYSQSVSDLSSAWHRWLVLQVVNRCGLFIAREKQTQEYLQSLGVPCKKIKMHADSAFLQEYLDQDKSIELLNSFSTSHRYRIGLTVTRWSFPGRDNPDQLFWNYINAMRKLADFMVEKLECDVFVFPQVTGPNRYSDDRITAREVFGQSNNKRIYLLEEEYSPEALKGMIRCMELFVGTRMHSNIFALGAEVPTVAIAYQEKTFGIMRELGLEQWVLDINTINGSDLVEKVETLWRKRREVRTFLKKKIPDLSRSAKVPAKLCRELYKIRQLGQNEGIKKDSTK